MNVTAKDILSIPAFKMVFELKKFEHRLAHFVEWTNKGGQLSASHVIKLLLQEYLKYRGISMGRRTVCYDFAWAVLEISPELWSNDEKQSGFCIMGDHLTDYFPDYIESPDDDVAILNVGEYVSGAFNILDEDIDQDDLRAAFSYAMYVFMNSQDWDDLDSIEVCLEENDA
ncbi:MAG: hypothetical protein IPM34_06635 [Saprospiraceae bacterium]|nr:hypothetical protein [Saprospiraceae bacterium]